jgi:hypothetical protein
VPKSCPHLWVHNLSRGGSRGHCRYPTDRVPLHTSLKSRQVAVRASTHCHLPYGSKPYLPAEVGSGAAMCHMALNLASRLRWAPVLPCVLWLRTSPPGKGGLRRCHVSYGSGPRLPEEVGSGATKYPMALDLTSRLRWASALPRIQRFLVGHGPQA